MRLRSNRLLYGVVLRKRQKGQSSPKVFSGLAFKLLNVNGHAVRMKHAFLNDAIANLKIVFPAPIFGNFFSTITY